MGGIRLLVAVALLAAVSVGCGSGESDAEAAADRKAAAAQERKEARQERERARLQRQTEALRECESETGALLESLQQIDSRLDVGLDADELSDYVGDASVAYDRVDFAGMSDACTLKAGIALESGLNEYIDSLNKWNDCIGDFSCELEGAVLRRIRKHWSEASERIEHVEEKFSSPQEYAKGPDSLTG